MSWTVPLLWYSGSCEPFRVNDLVAHANDSGRAVKWSVPLLVGLGERRKSGQMSRRDYGRNLCAVQQLREPARAIQCVVLLARTFGSQL